MSSHHDKLQWDEDQVQFLFDMMLEHAKILGMRTSGGLKETTMKVVEQKMMEAYGPIFTLKKIRNKLKRAKPDLQVMKEMLNASGFGWDPDKKII
uniref:Myb/SANT-like domain-containing protein n=1 Tax=Nymphaea colorata TaxID=210225 RepID=A0A5K0XDW5_9MAGN